MQAENWRWSNKGGVLVLYAGPDEHRVVLRTQPQAGNAYDLSETDAALIAAAPALLESLREMTALADLGVDLEESIHGPDKHGDSRERIAAAQEAIAKATR